MLFSEDFWTFIREHAHDDVSRLRLKYANNCDHSIAFAIEQIEARQKIAQKLPLWTKNERLLFPSSLSAEQASSEETAKYKQGLVQDKILSLCDLTGGLGVDTYYMSQTVPQVTYIERYSQYCDVAQHNFSELCRNNIHVVNLDCRDYLSKIHKHHDGYYIDPARRGLGNRRLYGIKDCEPDVLQLWPIVRSEGAFLLLKASPMLDIKQSINDLQYVSSVHVLSVKNECKELLFMMEPEIPKFSPSVFCIDLKNNHIPYIFSLEQETELPSSPFLSNKIGNYLYEPNSSILKAGAFKSVAQSYGIAKLDVNSHLYTSDNYLANFPGRTFEIVEIRPFSKQELKKCTQFYPQANVSVRNFPLSADELRHMGKIKDGGNIYLFATIFRQTKILIYCKKV